MPELNLTMDVTCHSLTGFNYCGMDTECNEVHAIVSKIRYTCLNPEQWAVAWKFHLQLNLGWKFDITLAVAVVWQLLHASAIKYPCQL